MEFFLGFLLGILFGIAIEAYIHYFQLKKFKKTCDCLHTESKEMWDKLHAKVEDHLKVCDFSR